MTKMKNIIRLIAAATAAFSCQRQMLAVQIEEEAAPLEMVTFHADTLIYGDAVTLRAHFSSIPPEPVHVDFVRINGRRVLFTHTLRPDPQTMTDTLDLGHETLKPGAHMLDFNVCHGNQHISCRMPFAVCPVSTEFLDEGGVYLYDGTLYSGCEKLEIQDGDAIEAELGGVRTVALLTGIPSREKDPYGLYREHFLVDITDTDIIEYEGIDIRNLKYYFHNPSTDRGECMAVLLSFYPKKTGWTSIRLNFWGEVLQIDIKVTEPKDSVKL